MSYTQDSGLLSKGFGKLSTIFTPLLLLLLLVLLLEEEGVSRARRFSTVKIRVQKDSFLKGWLMAERCAATSDALPVLTSILCSFGPEQITMESTDLKTSVRWKIPVSSLEMGDAFQLLLPSKTAGELLRKIPGETFFLEIRDGKAVFHVDRSRYRLTLFPVDSFPKLQSSQNATVLGSCSVEELRRLLEKGTFAGSINEEFPQYISGACFSINGQDMAVATTDTRRLALARGTISREEDSARQVVLPVRGLRELQKILAGCDAQGSVSLALDDAQAYFGLPEGEFSIRRMEAHFPPYENLLSIEGATRVVINKKNIMEALERLDVVVRNHTRVVVLDLSDTQGCRMTGQAPDVGTATETVEAEVTGSSLRVAFNVRFLLEGLKALEGNTALMNFNGSLGHLLISSAEHEDYSYIIMPVTLAEDDQRTADEGDLQNEGSEALSGRDRKSVV